jgi:hypothetical protein
MKPDSYWYSECCTQGRKELPMKLQTGLFLGATLAFAGCIDGKPDSDARNDNQRTGETGLAIATAVDNHGDTDVSKMEYVIKRVACVAGENVDKLTLTVKVNLEAMLLPGGIPAWENSPLDRNSEHPFADHFEVVPAGCYDVAATPLTAGGALSQDCAAAFENDVQVDDGYTTEIFMISQCKGAAVGAIDTVVALNKPPEINNLTFSPSKFITSGEKTTVCVTATDPNGDPVEFEWDQIGGSLCGASVIMTQKQGDITTQCADILPMEAGDYLFEVRMFDLLHDENNKLIRFETWLRNHGYPNASHDSLRFPVYVGAAAAAEIGL